MWSSQTDGGSASAEPENMTKIFGVSIALIVSHTKNKMTQFNSMTQFYKITWT